MARVLGIAWFCNGLSEGQIFWGCGDAGPHRTGLCEIKRRESGWPISVLESRCLPPTSPAPDFPRLSDFPQRSSDACQANQLVLELHHSAIPVEMPKFREFDWYQTPIYYDIIFSTFTQREADFLEAVYKKYVKSRGRNVLEPACGTGRLMAELAARGFRVYGFDTSQAMLKFARNRFKQRHVRGVLKRASFEDFAFRQYRFDLAFCLVNSFRHILDKAHARRHLGLVANHLKPGGVYVIGLHVAQYKEDMPVTEQWEAERDGMRVVCKIKTWVPNRKTRTNKMRARIRSTKDGRVERFESNWVARTYSVHQLRSLIRSEPRFKLISCHDFHYKIKDRTPLDGNRYDCVLILQRMASTDSQP